MLGFVFIFVILIASLAIIFYTGVYLYKRNVPFWQYPIALLYVLWFLFFLFFGSLFSAEYTEAIDPIDDNYTFISGQYRLTFLIFFLLYHVALWTLWVRKAKLPPLPLVLCLYRHCYQCSDCQPALRGESPRRRIGFVSYIQ